MPGVTEPTVTRVGKHHMKIEFPDPPQPTYQVAHEVLVQMIETINDLADEMPNI